MELTSSPHRGGAVAGGWRCAMRIYSRTVEKCIECPLFHFTRCACSCAGKTTRGNRFRKIKTALDVIPHWCPLPVADEKEEPSDTERLHALWKWYADHDDKIGRYDLDFIRKAIDEELMADDRSEAEREESPADRGGEEGKR